MATRNQRYAVLSATPLYGPRWDYKLLGVYDDATEAAEAARQHHPDYDPEVQADRLAPNQFAATYGCCKRVLWEGCNPYDDWDRLPGWVQDAAEGRMEPGDGDPDDALMAALDDLDLALLAPDEHGDSYILVRRPGVAG